MRKVDRIDPALYEKYDVKRGLRNVNGTGVLEISSSNTFSSNCEMRISDGGKVRIGSGVVQKVHRLYIDGRPVGKRGLYGGAESSGNKRYADYLEGEGLLEVKGCGRWCVSFR